MSIFDDAPSSKLFLQKLDNRRKLQSQVPQEEYFESGLWKQQVVILLLGEIGKAIIFCGSEGLSGSYTVDVQKDKLITLGISEKTVGKYLRGAVKEVPEIVQEFGVEFKKLEVVSGDGTKEDPDSFDCVIWELELIDEE